MKLYFAVFGEYLVTANKDGAIPLDSKVVAQLRDIDETLMRALLQQANEWEGNP